jgi:hypothetical protein
MRSLETFVLLAFIALIGLGAWNFRYLLLHPSLPVAASAANAKAGTSNPSRPGAAKTNAHTKSGKGATRVHVGDPVIDELLSSTTVDVIIPGPRFPEAKELTPGMTSGEIRSNFGEPIARTTKAENGEIAERYYYIDKDHTRLTVANLLAGVVVSAESKRL